MSDKKNILAASLIYKSASLVFGLLILSLTNCAHAAPCYGTKMPQKGKIFMGIETHTIFKRYLEDEFGKLRSTQRFLLLSYGVYDWLSIDLKGGAGNIKQHPLGSDEADYSTSFAGGYGIRARLLERNNFKAVLGFQHISVHPMSNHVGDAKDRAILDDWQWSLLASYRLKRITPYAGGKWSRVDYIHKVDDDRKRRMSDLTKSIGVVAGCDFEISRRIWLNLEGQFVDGTAMAASLNYSF